MMDEGELEEKMEVVGGGGCTEGEMGVACGDGGRDLQSMFERNTAARVSERPQTSAICKNNLSNYEERLLAFPSGMFYCTPSDSPARASYIQLLYTFECGCILLLIM